MPAQAQLSFPVKKRHSTKEATKLDGNKPPPTKRGRFTEIRSDLSATPEILVKAKQLFGLGYQQTIVGRDKELTKILGFIKDAVENDSPGAMYISGLPGTGKTLCVKNAIMILKEMHSFCSMYINCMQASKAAELGKRIYEIAEAEGIFKKTKPSGRTLDDLEKYFSRSNHMTLICFDEIDEIHSKQPALFNRIFEWPHLEGSNVTVIGIANTFNLTDHLPTRQRVKMTTKPVLLNFSAYVKDDVIAILKSRMSGLNGLFEPGVVELIAGKCASVTGDVRKALDICKLAIERGAEKRSKPSSVLGSVQPTASCDSTNVLDTVRDVYGSSCEKSYGGLPPQQKLLFMAAYSLTSNNIKQFTFDKLLASYKQICKEAFVPCVADSDARNLCDFLVSSRLLRRCSKPTSLIVQYSLEASEATIKDILASDHKLRSLLQRP